MRKRTERVFCSRMRKRAERVFFSRKRMGDFPIYLNPQIVTSFYRKRIKEMKHKSNFFKSKS